MDLIPEKWSRQKWSFLAFKLFDELEWRQGSKHAAKG